MKGKKMTHWQIQLDGIHRCVKGPCKLMLPQSLHNHILHVL